MVVFLARCFIFFCVVISAHASIQYRHPETFMVGAGRYDITGPAASQGMMGYGMIEQQTAGIHDRLWARAFVIESWNHEHVVIVNADLGQIFQGVKQEVVKKLKRQFGTLYDEKNVLLTATHTHSGPGGYSTYAFYNLTTLGFSRENFNTIVDGIVNAIALAHQSKREAVIRVAAGDLHGISHNRSPTAYRLNPPEELKKYAYDYDPEMVLLRFDTPSGQPIGLITWFPLHGVSLNNKNRLISGDNKGVAEYLFEKHMRAQGYPNFVAAFAQAHSGDVSPNPLGHEGGDSEKGFQKLLQAGVPQYQKAMALYDAAKPIYGPIGHRHMHVDMDKVVVLPEFANGHVQKTCPAAIGVSMLAGTQDGEGIGRQGVTCDTISKILPRFICEKRRTECQGVKPIAIETGTMKPYPWTPNRLPFQLFKIGNVVIASLPFELTTMSGRRLKETLAKYFKEEKIIISALANAYAGYVATPEEYQLQRYEGASTHFGPWTLNAIQQNMAKLAAALVKGESIAPGPDPIDLTDKQINLQPGVVMDQPPLLKHFGDVARNVNPNYRAGETVEVDFWGAHPKNNYHTMGSFLEIQRLSHGQWQAYRTDHDFETVYSWERSGISASLNKVFWYLPNDVENGLYRIVHFGDARSIFGKITPYTGYSRTFSIGQ